MENQLELDELRKASQELNAAFSFRRSINTDEVSDFNEVAQKPEGAETEVAEAAAAGGAAVASAPPKKRRVKRRRVKKEVAAEASVATEEGVAMAADYGTVEESNVPDLDMADAFPTEEEQLREERMARLASGTQPTTEDDSGKPESKAEEQERFAAQLSGQWNDSVLENEDQLGPLAKIMDRLAILEEEKKAGLLRLDEEFRLRNELEEKFYQQKRQVLEEAAAEVQAAAYAGMGGDGGDEATSDTS